MVARLYLLPPKRADALLAQGDAQGFGAWTKIAKAITELERKRREGEAVN